VCIRDHPWSNQNKTRPPSPPPVRIRGHSRSFAVIRVETETPRPRNGNPTQSSANLHPSRNSRPFACHSRPFAFPSNPHPSVSIRAHPWFNQGRDPSDPLAPPAVAKGADSGIKKPRLSAVRSSGARRDEALASACGWAADSVGSRRSAGNSVAWKNDSALERSTVERLSPPRTMDPMAPPPSPGKTGFKECPGRSLSPGV
jgi:hypothetical protein